MSKPFQLTIPEPCHEDWNKMDPSQKGKFCGSCQKEVIDFTSMSDAELMAFFHKPKGNTCGHFNVDQLHRNIEKPTKRKPWLNYFFRIAIPAFLASGKAQAQGSVRQLTGDTIVACPTPREVLRGKVAARVPETLIKGRIMSEQGLPLSGTSIFVKGMQKGVVSDSAGNFALRLPVSAKPYTLVVSYVGYDVKEVSVIGNKATDALLISLVERITTMDGMVMIVARPVKQPKKPIQKIVDTVRNAIRKPIDKAMDTTAHFIKLSPNPVKPGQSLQVGWSQLEEGYYQFQLISSTGATVLNREIWIDKQAKMIELSIPNTSAGIYYLQVRSKKTGKFFTEALSVM